MTDKELIQMLRTCHRTECVDCEARAICDIVIDEEIQMDVYVADRLEALLAENERLKAQLPKWVSVKERLPEFWNFVLAIDHDGLMSTAYYVEEWHGMLDCDAVTHWMPLPSTEGVE